MTLRRIVVVASSFTLFLFAQSQKKSASLLPPKQDVAYLVQGDHLVATEVQQPTKTSTKEGEILSITGASSPARTSLPEPILLLTAAKISPEQLALKHFQVRNGKRELATAHQKSEENEEDLRITLRRLDNATYRIEATHMLEPGEYALVAGAGTSAFCFSVY